MVVITIESNFYFTKKVPLKNNFLEFNYFREISILHPHFLSFLNGVENSFFENFMCFLLIILIIKN